MEDSCADICNMPDDCIAEVIARTSPRDACRFAVTSTCFQSVLDSDFIWQAFLPSDYASVLSRAVQPVVYTSKKDLFFKLSERHVLIDGGTMSFGLDKDSGAKCFMLSASLLEIGFTKEPNAYWRHLSIAESRFAQVMEPMMQCWLSICGEINLNELSPRTRYCAYLVYKLKKTTGDFPTNIGRSRQRAFVCVSDYCTERIVYLEPFYDRQVKKLLGEWNVSCDEFGETAKIREDGWMEVEVGKFYNNNGEGSVHIRLREVDGYTWQGGIIVEGMEIRPEHSKLINFIYN